MFEALRGHVQRVAVLTGEKTTQPTDQDWFLYALLKGERGNAPNDVPMILWILAPPDG